MEYAALILFTISTSITPGPNNVMIMTSGANHGFRKSIPHLLGIELGFPAMLVAIGLGAAEIFQQFPVLFTVLKIIGTVYLTYLALKIATAPVQNFEHRHQQPLTFLQAALFQWVNPKAWVMAIGAVVTYTIANDTYLTQVFIIAGLFVVFGTPCTITWLWFGSSLKKVLSEPLYLRIFNITMATFLCLSLLPVISEIVSSELLN